MVALIAAFQWVEAPKILFRNHTIILTIVKLYLHYNDVNVDDIE